MDGGGGVDEFFDGLKVVCAEDLAVFEIRYEEGVGRRCGL